MPSVPKACLLPLGASLLFVALLEYATHTNKPGTLGHPLIKLCMAMNFINFFATYWQQLYEKRGGQVVIASATTGVLFVAIMGVLCAAQVPALTLGLSRSEMRRWFLTITTAIGYGGMLLGAFLKDTRATRARWEDSRRAVVSGDVEASAGEAGEVGEAGIENEISASLNDTSEKGVFAICILAEANPGLTRLQDQSIPESWQDKISTETRHRSI